ncbi:uncharacterized protein LOC141618137 [Silene latifolia]|uniref:uncharacterized protein LOC141618137 n=1 Tax=Silene latifolia TaxID=37657 RepID=UPI003D76DF98
MKFWFTVVYGSNSDTDRLYLWQQLTSIKDICIGAWCVGGDFNNILHFNERLGSTVLWRELVDFRNCVDYCELLDIKAQGSFYTWNNKQGPHTRVFSRIDRFLLNQDWMDLHPDSYAYFLNEGCFDHNPCIFYRRPGNAIRKSHFRYFNMWGQAPNFLNIIQSEWQKEVKGVKMQKFSDIEKAAELAKFLLDKIQTEMHLHPHDTSIREQEQAASQNYFHLHKAQLSYLKQKTEPYQIEAAFLEYYNDLLGTSKETVSCIFSIPSSKAPGPDGFSRQFFKDSWSIIRTEVYEAIVDFFHTGKLLKQLNATLVTLIPKVDNPTSVLEFRPIACCNLIYKCISKLLCTRLGEVLPDIVNPNQGGFIKGRNIVENVLICQDLIRLYNRKSASPRCLIKIDLRKAYDTIEWNFLHHMLTALQFPKVFIDKIMVYVISTTYSLALNGNSFCFFHGKRGLGQGDPLSPLLFTLCMEYLSRILNVVGGQDDFRFHPLCGPMKLNHLLFADDLLLFSKGNTASIMWMLSAFSTFSDASGLCLNRDKSDIYFNGVSGDVIAEIMQVSGFRKGTLPFGYLGVPISSKKLSKNDCMQLVDMITMRIRAWGARQLSYSGRLALINSMLTSLHSYWASIFLIPNGIMKKIDNICRNFLWCGKHSYLRSPNVHWDKCCSPKAEGGLGIRASKLWNKALLGKYIWWLANKKDHLWVRWINHIYMKGIHWSNYNPPNDCSWAWKKIAHTMSTFKQAYTNDCWLASDKAYTVADGSQWLCLVNPQVPWHHVFQLQRLLTKDRMHRMGFGHDSICYLCDGADENHNHLFYQCPFSIRCVDLLQHQLGVQFPVFDLCNWNAREGRWSQLQRRIIRACHVGLIYAIWRARNKARLDHFVSRPKWVVYQVIKEVTASFWARNTSVLTTRDVDWLKKIST